MLIHYMVLVLQMAFDYCDWCQRLHSFNCVLMSFTSHWLSHGNVVFVEARFMFNDLDCVKWHTDSGLVSDRQ